MKLSRIETLASLVCPSSTEVWDLCCDHGKIGLAVYKRNPHLKINFVDQVPSIVEQLLTSVNAYIPQGSFQIKCEDVRTTRFTNNSSIILAGVGGILCCQVLESLLEQNLEKVQLILSPHQDIHLVREYVASRFSLVSERLVIENKIGYEILELAPGYDPHRPVSLIGDQMWDRNNQLHRAYAAKHLRYLRIKAQHSPAPLETKVLNFFEILMSSF